MKVSFDLKKGGAIKILFAILLIIAIFQVVGQATYMNWANPYYSLAGTTPINTPIPAGSAYHPLQLISVSSASLFSVDGNGNGIIDFAENARWTGASAFANNSAALAGVIPTNNTISKGCVVEDTGKFYYSGTSGGVSGDAWVGKSYLSLLIPHYDVSTNTWYNENICSDGDGCKFTIIRYTQSGNPSGLLNYYTGNGNAIHGFFQLPDKYQSGAYTAQWIDEAGAIAINGDTTATLIVNWGNTPNWLDVYDDDTSLETVPDQLTVYDRLSGSSFVVSFCD